MSAPPRRWVKEAVGGGVGRGRGGRRSGPGGMGWAEHRQGTAGDGGGVGRSAGSPGVQLRKGRRRAGPGRPVPYRAGPVLKQGQPAGDRPGPGQSTPRRAAHGGGRAHRSRARLWAMARQSARREPGPSPTRPPRRSLHPLLLSLRSGGGSRGGCSREPARPPTAVPPRKPPGVVMAAAVVVVVAAGRVLERTRTSSGAPRAGGRRGGGSPAAAAARSGRAAAASMGSRAPHLGGDGGRASVRLGDSCLGKGVCGACQSLSRSGGGGQGSSDIGTALSWNDEAFASACAVVPSLDGITRGLYGLEDTESVMLSSLLST